MAENATKWSTVIGGTAAASAIVAVALGGVLKLFELLNE